MVAKTKEKKAAKTKEKKAAKKKAAAGKAEPLKGGKGTKAQMAVPASMASQLDPTEAPDKYEYGDDELVADPETRGWVTYSQVKDRQKKASEADKKAAESSVKAVEKSEADKKVQTTQHGEPVPEEVAERRQEAQEAAERTAVVPETNDKEK